MVKIDFDRQGLDDGWTVAHKSVSTTQSINHKQMHADLASMTLVDILPFEIALQEEQSVLISVVQQDQQRQPSNSCESNEDNITTELVDGKEPEQATQTTESNAEVILIEADEPDTEQQQKNTQPEQPRGFLSCFSDCFHGLAEMMWPASSLQATTNDSEPQHESDLQKVLLESASVHETKEVSIALARVRLQQALDRHQAKAVPVAADGNCQFLALSQQLFGDESKHDTLRLRVVEHLQAMPERYSGFVFEPWPDYIKRMALPCEWGDNVTLQAASDMLGVEIHVLNDQPGAECVRVHPMKASEEAKQPLCLAFLAELHYDAVELLQPM